MLRFIHMTQIGCLGAALAAGSSLPATAADLSGCEYEGTKLWGKVKEVTSFADIKVEIVESFADLKVEKVTGFADNCGEWEMVDSFEDFAVEFVDGIGDIKVEFVTGFAGLP